MVKHTLDRQSPFLPSLLMQGDDFAQFDD